MKQSYAIETRNLTKKFGAFTALSELNLRIENSAIHGLPTPYNVNVVGRLEQMLKPIYDQNR